MTTIVRAMNSIGKKCFIDNYEDFKNCTDKKKLAERLLTENANASSYSAQLTRINYANWIFENQLEHEALELVVSSNRIDNLTKIKAKEILRNNRTK